MLRAVDEAMRRSAVRKLENAHAFPLIALLAIRELRADLDEVEAASILRARELGASLEDIADAMGITRQGVAYRIKQLAVGDAPTAGIVDLAEDELDRPGVP
jgi:hypothetical protein